MLLFETFENKRMHTDTFYKATLSDYKSTQWDLNKLIDIFADDNFKLIWWMKIWWMKKAHVDMYFDLIEVSSYGRQLRNQYGSSIGLM